MLLQALHVEIEMQNINHQVTLLVQKGAGTHSHNKKGVPTPAFNMCQNLFWKK